MSLKVAKGGERGRGSKENKFVKLFQNKPRIQNSFQRFRINKQFSIGKKTKKKRQRNVKVIETLTAI